MPDPTPPATAAEHIAAARQQLEPWPPTAGQLVADVQKRMILAQGHVIHAQLALLEGQLRQTEPGA